MNKEDFDRGLEYNDFSIGDSFWLNGIKFEVVNKDREDFK